jgi:hypothetical protein
MAACLWFVKVAEEADNTFYFLTDKRDERAALRVARPFLKKKFGPFRLKSLNYMGTIDAVETPRLPSSKLKTRNSKLATPQEAR